MIYFLRYQEIFGPSYDVPKKGLHRASTVDTCDDPYYHDLHSH